MLIDWDGDGKIDELDWILADMVLFDDEYETEDADKMQKSSRILHSTAR